jgi:hypothetical protein
MTEFIAVWAELSLQNRRKVQKLWFSPLTVCSPPAGSGYCHRGLNSR